jgi:hypothetical protein
MTVNKPVKQRASTGADTLVRYLHHPAKDLANRGFREPSRNLEVEREAFGIAKPFCQFLGKILFSGVWLEVVVVRHGAGIVSQ